MLRTASRPRGGGLRSAAVIAALLALAAGCDTAPADDNKRNPDLSAPLNSGAAPAQNAEDQVVAAYKEFWQRLRYVEDEPQDEWKAYLGEVAVDPQLRISLQATRFQKLNGITLYGDVAHRITDVEINGDKATVDDCQDASKTGQADAKTGKRKTVGVARDPVRAAMKRIDNETWKVSKITFAGGEC